MPGLTRGQRRRLLEAGEAGVVSVLGHSEVYGFRGPGRGQEGPRQRIHKGSLCDIGVRTDVLAFDLDVRKLVRRLQLDLAEHYRDMILSGRQADGVPMPRQSESTLGDGRLGVRSTTMARRYSWGRVSGHQFTARGIVFPFMKNDPGDDDPGAHFNRKAWVARATEERIALVSIDGAAARVISATVSRWLEDSKTDKRGRARTRKRAATRAGDLLRP